MLHSYLKVLFPYIVIGISVLTTIIPIIQHAIVSRRKAGYQPIGNGNVFGVPGHVEEDEEEDDCDDSDDQEPLTINGGRLTLSKTKTKDSVLELDRPRAQLVMVILETAAITGLIIINIVALATTAYGRKGFLASLTGVIVWSYVLVLASLRLFLTNTKFNVPQLWNHTATIYSCIWLFELIIFRSAIIHPRSRTAQVLVITEFALATLLFAIAITTRKGNKAVVLEYENGLEPSREPLASLFSIATFSWVDAIVYQGYIKTFEIADIWNLTPSDKAASVLKDYRQLKKTTKLTWHLLYYFRGKLFKQCVYAFLSGWFTFAPTLLLKAILEYIENANGTPRNVIWLYVILLAFTDIIRSLLDQQALWIGRKVCIQLRAIIIGEIYAKALRRKAATSKETELGDKKDKNDKDDAAKTPKWKRMLGLGGRKEDKKNATKADADAQEAAAAGNEKGAADSQVNVGTIINLMSVDSFKVAEISGYLHYLLSSAPTQLIVCIILLYRILGLSAIPGFIVMVLLVPVNIGIAMGFGKAQKRIMAATDKRIHTTNEVLQNIRIIKFFAWEQRFSKMVGEKRSVELKALRTKYIIWACAVAIWNTVPVLITFFSFLVYTLIEKKPLYPSIAFTAISLFSILRVPLDQLGDMIAHVQESAVSVNRVEEFLNEEETEKYEQLAHANVDEDGNEIIGFRDGTFSWGSKDETVMEDENAAFRLIDISADFVISKLNVIAGPTGSGKTSMLMALLGEMTRIKGEVFLPGGYSREDVLVDPETGLTETVAYCAQQPWLVNANIRENILFSAPFNEQRYKDVIVACALERDLEILDNGDQTLVGEKGITLSGGQKQRVSLARALYSNSKHVLLDDVLSAVDAHTAKWIFDNCIMGPLMRDRTCILVTHNVALTVPFASHVVVLENGKIVTQGDSEAVIASGRLGEEVHSSNVSGKVSRIPSRVPSDVGDEATEALVEDGVAKPNDGRLNGAASGKDTKPKNPNKTEAKDAMEENKAVGGVKFEVMWLYFKAMGTWWFWAIVILVFGVQQLASLAANVWIREWANQYEIQDNGFMSSNSFLGDPASMNSMATGPRLSVKLAPYFDPKKSSLLAMMASDVDVTYYLAVYAIIGLGGMFVAVFRDIWLFYGSLTASWKIHERLMKAVTRAKFRFFDVTPLGQLMNRFSKDLESVDQEVAPIAIGVMGCALAILVTVGLIASITPGFLIAAVFISGMYFLVGKFYIRSSRDLKRLESVQRSPLFQQFGETLSGITTIRAYGDEKRFIRDNMLRVNTHNRPFIYLWATNRWLSFRIDVVGDLVAFFAGMFVILSIGTIDAGSAGLSLSYALTFTENVLWLVRLYAMLEQNMNSVERIKEYLDVEQEAEAIVEKTRPAANWPSQGGVEFINYTTRYRSDLEPVLRNVTFKVAPQEKVGIVGRTGAGKSSLALALFRGLEAETGKILIDDIDVGLIGLQDLRESITIVPQDPTLFTGTIRSNLDPFSLFTDEDIFTALRRVQLIGASGSPDGASSPVVPAVASLRAEAATETSESGTSTPTTNKNIFLNLSSPVAESGNNLSQGQRQLLCLARALLKQPKVLMMDEATASIDYTTDSKIQETIREIDATILTIAHRLQTVADYDKVLVLDKGEVVEYGHPYELMRRDGNDAIFKGMCEMSGESEALLKTAKKAWESRRLVDDE